MIEDVQPQDTWAVLQRDARAQLVDVRTNAEWTFVGVPDLTPVGKQVLTISWQVPPTMAVNPDFVAEEPDFPFNEGRVRARVTYSPRGFLRRVGGAA